MAFKLSRLLTTAKYSFYAPFSGTSYMQDRINARYYRGRIDCIGLFGLIYFAVPKRKTTPSRRRIRNRSSRTFQPLRHIVRCRNCGLPKERHRVCSCDTRVAREKPASLIESDWVFDGFPGHCKSVDGTCFNCYEEVTPSITTLSSLLKWRVFFQIYLVSTCVDHASP